MPEDPQGGNLCVWQLADPQVVDLLEEEAANTPATPTTPSTPQVEEKEEEVKQETWQDANGNVCVFKMSYKPTMEEVFLNKFVEHCASIGHLFNGTQANHWQLV